MNESFVTINNNTINIPLKVYAKRNANSLLLSGHVFHSIENHDEVSNRTLHVSSNDRNTILDQLENAECWLFPAINAMGELIAAVDNESLEDNTLNNAGYLVSTLTEFLYSVQYTRNLVLSCAINEKEDIK